VDGVNAVCTITNNDKLSVLHLRKLVVNDDIGTALPTAWTLKADDGKGTTLTGATPVDSGTDFKAGTYTLSESGPTGYTASAWSCTGGTQSGDKITLAPGQVATCTITNNDNGPMMSGTAWGAGENQHAGMLGCWSVQAGRDGCADRCHPALSDSGCHPTVTLPSCCCCQPVHRL
jgi:Prealbumin-like fold domain